MPVDEVAGIEAMGKLLAKSPAVAEGGEEVSNAMVATPSYTIHEAVSMVKAAENWVREKFAGRMRNQGREPAIAHIERVAKSAGPYQVTRTVAWLHDLVEDTDVTLGEVRERFGDRIARAVEAETWQNGESYQDYIARLSRNPDAIRSKLEDIADNMGGAEAELKRGEAVWPEPIDLDSFRLGKAEFEEMVHRMPRPQKRAVKLAQWRYAKERLEQALEALPEMQPTSEKTTLPDGQAREPWREKQMRMVLDEQRPVEHGQAPVAVFMGGGPAAGKTRLLMQMQRLGSVPKNLVMVSADDFKVGTHEEYLKGERRISLPAIPEYTALIEQGEKRAATVVHRESGDMARKTRAMAIAERRSFAWDGTMAWPAEEIRDIKAAKAAGFKVVLLAVGKDIKQALADAERRFEEKGRWLPEKVLVQAHQEFAANLEAYYDLMDDVYVYDKSEVPEGVLIAYKQAKNRVVIKDQRAYGKLLERGKRQPGKSEDAGGDRRDAAADAGGQSGGPEIQGAEPGDRRTSPAEGEVALSDVLAGDLEVEHGMSGAQRLVSGRPSALTQDINRFRAATAPQTLDEPSMGSTHSLV
jgi:predicted ABC-type ATPase